MTGFFKHEPRLANQPRAKAQEKRTTTASNELELETGDIQTSELQGSSKAAAKINDIAGGIIACFLIVAPIPIGANHPVAWLGFAAAISAFATIYALLVLYSDPIRPSRSCRYPVLFSLGAGLILYCAAQLLPVGFGNMADLPEHLLPRHLTLTAPATALGLLRLSSYALLFVLILEIATNSNRTEWVLKWIFYGVVLHAVWALISLSFLGDTLLFSEKTAYSGFATGTFVNRNSFATYLSMGLMIGLGRLLFLIYGPSSRSKRRDTLMQRLTVGFFVQATLSGVILMTLLATGSRLGVFSAIAGGLFLLSVILAKTHRFSRWKLGLVLIATAGTTFLAAIAATPMLADRIVFLEQSALSRIELFRQSLDMILERPLLGYGLDSFAASFEVFHQPDLATEFVWDKPHNTYLTLWAELGLIVGGFPILIIGICFVRMLLQVQRRKNTYLPAAVASAVVVVCAVHSLGDFSLEMAANAYLFIVLTGIGISEKA